MNDGNKRMDDVIAPSADIPPQPSAGAGVPNPEVIDLIASSPVDPDSDRSESPVTIESSGGLGHHQPTVGDAMDEPHVVDMPESKVEVSIPPAPEAGNARQIDITTPEVATDGISVPPQPGVGGNPTPESQVADSLPSDPETAEEIGDVALGADNEQEPDKPALDEEVIDLGEGKRPMLTPEGESEQAEDSISEVASGNSSSSESDSVSAETIDEPDKEVTRAGDKAVAKLMDGMPKDLSPEEQKTIDAIRERVRSSAEEEALADKEKSPEALVFKKLDAIRSRLEEAGLSQDAELVAGQAERLQKLIEQATEIIHDPKERPLFERPGQPDVSRLWHLVDKISKSGERDRDLASRVPLSVDLGNGRREDRLGFWYDSEDQAQDNSRIEENGGLRPLLSDQAVELLLQESEILSAGESLSSLEVRSERDDLEYNFYYEDLSRDGGKVQLAKKIPGGQTVQYSVYAVDGRIERRVSIGLDSNFVIDAALRRINAA